MGLSNNNPKQGRMWCLEHCNNFTTVAEQRIMENGTWKLRNAAESLILISSLYNFRSKPQENSDQ